MMTDEKLSPIIHGKDLVKLYKTNDLVLVDASGSQHAKKNYQEKHLEGALFIDLNTQLADIQEDVSVGGRHPLPDIEKFAGVLTGLGISPNSHVVIYDDANASNAAARFWWMLRSAGHEKVQVLNGGLEAAEKAGFPISGEMVIPKKSGPYKVSTWMLPLTDMKEVEKVSRDENFLVIDVRDSERYKGNKEPIDLVAGHIPGAVNVPFTTNLDSNGMFLPPHDLRNKYENLFQNKKSENVIVHCGSGVTACHTLLAIAYAGLEIPKLYAGSWSEWSRNNLPIEKSN